MRIEEEARVIEADFGRILLELRQGLRDAVASSATFPTQIQGVLARDRAADGRGWLIEAIVSGVVAIAAGLVVAILFERMTMSRLPAPSRLPPGDEEAGTAARLARTMLRLVGTLLLIAVGFGVIEAMDTGVDVRHRTALILLVVFACARAALLIARPALSPEDPPGAATAAETAKLRGWVTAFILVYAVVAALDWWLLVLGMDDEPRNLATIILSLGLAAVLCALCLANRRTIPAAFGAPVHGGRSLGSLFGRYWWVLAIAYVVVAWFARAVYVLLGWTGLDGVVTAPAPLLLVGLILYSFLHLIGGRAVQRSPVLWIGGPGTHRLRDYRDLAHNAAGLIVLLICFAVLAHLWGASLVGAGIGATLVKVAAICAVGWIVYDMVRIAIDRKHAREGGIPNITSDDETFAPLPVGKSRLATLLPMARVLVLSVIVVIVVMMVLMELGVNVVPLFAGASIFGLAIGFGSQTLVRDVMSGAFFLVDDAFRVGEYVDIGGGSKGTVEKISIRSFQLRHQNGPLHTIPFGDIKQITNLSRDWAITKLPFTFPHGTDVEQVRKVIKKAGEALAADPELGPHFLQPPKSQGVVAMDAKAMTFAVKFMTLPADASMARRAVNARLSLAFIDAGLKFATPSVTVRIANEGAAPLSEDQKLAVATGAALQIPSSGPEPAAGAGAGA